MRFIRSSANVDPHCDVAIFTLDSQCRIVDATFQYHNYAHGGVVATRWFGLLKAYSSQWATRFPRMRGLVSYDHCRAIVWTAPIPINVPLRASHLIRLFLVVPWRDAKIGHCNCCGRGPSWRNTK